MRALLQNTLQILNLILALVRIKVVSLGYQNGKNHLKAPNAMTSQQILPQLAALKNSSIECISHLEIEGTNWGSFRIAGSVYTFDFTKTGKVKHVAFYATVAQTLNFHL